MVRFVPKKQFDKNIRAYVPEKFHSDFFLNQQKKCLQLQKK